MSTVDVNDLVERIAAGKATLLGIDEICQRLGISRTTLDRWVRNSGGKLNSHGSIAEYIGDMGLGVAPRAMLDTSPEGRVKFPPPDIRIGNSPKWELETFKSWLRANAK